MAPAEVTRGGRRTDSPADEPHARRRPLLRVAVVAIAVIFAGAAGAYLWASAQYRASGDERAPMTTRLPAAEAADAAWPFSDAFRARAVTLRGLTLFEGGDILGAYDVLHAEYVREAIAKRFDPELAAAHALVYKEYWAWSSRAAHVMHGKEQPDGTIKLEDVQHFPRPPEK
jgi:hypothetical protein